MLHACAGRASAMAQVAGTWQGNGGQEKGGRKVSRERGTRGNESRALKFSLCKHGSRHASHKTRQRYLARLCLATGKRHLPVCIRVCIYSALHASGSASEWRPLVAYSSVLGADEEFNVRARASSSGR